MSQHLISSEIELATCNRCKAYVFTCLVGGLRVSVDPVPIASLDEYRAALMAGRATYRLQERAGRPYALERESPGVARGGAVVAAHGCGCAGQDATGVEVVEKGPQRAPATLGGLPGGIPLSDVSGALERSPVDSASRPRFDHVRRSVRCAVCDRVVTCHDSAIALEFPEPYTRLERVGKAKDGIMREVHEVGVRHWAVHEECM